MHRVRTGLQQLADGDGDVDFDDIDASMTLIGQGQFEARRAGVAETAQRKRAEANAAQARPEARQADARPSACRAACRAERCPLELCAEAPQVQDQLDLSQRHLQRVRDRDWFGAGVRQLVDALSPSVRVQRFDIRRRRGHLQR